MLQLFVRYKSLENKCRVIYFIFFEKMVPEQFGYLLSCLSTHTDEESNSTCQNLSGRNCLDNSKVLM